MCSNNEEATHVGIAALRYSAKALFAATGMFARNKPDPRRKFAPRLELRGIEHRGGQKCRIHRANTWYRSKSPTDRICAMPCHYTLLQYLNFPTQIVELGK